MIIKVRIAASGAIVGFVTVAVFVEVIAFPYSVAVDVVVAWGINSPTSLLNRA